MANATGVVSGALGSLKSLLEKPWGVYVVILVVVVVLYLVYSIRRG